MIAILTIAFMNSSNFSTHDPANKFKITNNEVRRSLSSKILEKVVQDKALRAKTIGKVQALPDQIHRNGVDAPLSQQNNLDTLYFKTVQDSLGNSPAGRQMFQEYRSIFQQMMMQSLLREIFPVGMFGIFCLLMIMLLVSTDDCRIFNATGTLVQDMVLPCYTFFCKKRLSLQTHLLILRLTTLGVSMLFFAIAIWFRNLDYINMFTAIISSFWVAGSGPVMVFGLYSRFGNLTGAWCSMIFGSGTALVGLICQRNWAQTLYPWLENNDFVSGLDHFLWRISSPFEPWIHWRMNPYKFPINSYEIFFMAMIISLASYVLASYLTYKPYDLDKLLHRGKYAENTIPRVKTSLSFRALLGHLVSITPEYTKGDKVIAWSVFIYSFIYKLGLSFVCVVICNCFFRWPKEWWGWYFYINGLLVPGIIAIFTTVWFMWGGIVDMKHFIHDLEVRKIDNEDNGQVLEKDQIVKE